LEPRNADRPTALGETVLVLAVVLVAGIARSRPVRGHFNMPRECYVHGLMGGEAAVCHDTPWRDITLT